MFSFILSVSTEPVNHRSTLLAHRANCLPQPRPAAPAALELLDCRLHGLEPGQQRGLDERGVRVQRRTPRGRNGDVPRSGRHSAVRKSTVGLMLLSRATCCHRCSAVELTEEELAKLLLTGPDWLRESEDRGSVTALLLPS